MTTIPRAGAIFVVGFLGVGGIQAMTGILDPSWSGDSSAVASSSTAKSVKPGTVPEEYQGMINKWGKHCSTLTPQILAAQIQQESGWRANAQSKDKAGNPIANGIAQFIPSTWSAHGIDGDGDGDKDVWDPKDAIPSAATYNCKLADWTSEVPGNRQTNMLAAYNAGTGAVKEYGGVPPYSQTQNYVKNIPAMAEKFK